MAKILDKLYNRVIDGEILEISDAEIAKLGLAKASDIPTQLGTKLYSHYLHDESELHYLEIISTSPDSITEKSEIQRIVTDYIVGNIYDDDNYDTVYNVVYYSFSPLTGEVSFKDSSGQTGIFEISNAVDTVTPL